MPRRPPARPKDLRRAVLDASLALVEEGGVGALSMREVARRARVTHAAPYHHFADRAAILAGLAEEGFTRMRDALSAATRRQPRGTVARFEACGRAYVRFALEHPGHMRIMFRPELASPAEHPAVDVAASAAMQVLVECVAECQAAGVMAAGDSTAIVLTSWSAMHGLASLWIDGPLCRIREGAGSPEELARLVARTLGGLFTYPRSCTTSHSVSVRKSSSDRR
jgi:AcrR family transcriptional regulator